MQTMLFETPGSPLVAKEMAKPRALEGQLLVRIQACGVCRTDLHILEGELIPPLQPLILGHQIVGIVEEAPGSTTWKPGDRVGIPWLANTCGVCSYCKQGKENLCDQALFTGFHVHGGFAEYTTCKAKYAIALPTNKKATELAPLLCAGLIGFRAYQKVKEAKTLGFYGFGSSAHILLQIARQENKEVFVFTKENDLEGQKLAKKLGATWAGSSLSPPPTLLQACLIFAPIGELVPFALRALEKGGTCLLAGIHMSDIPTFAYEDLFFEKTLTSISHLTREDSRSFFSFYHDHEIRPEVTVYPLLQANEALQDLKKGTVKGSLVLHVSKDTL